MPNPQNLKPFTGADDPRRVNGPPKGTKHISTWIQEMLNDEDFEANILDAKKGMIEFKGAPLKAIIGVAVTKAINGDKQWADWLANNGYGNTLKIQVQDNRKEILDKYLGADDARQIEAPKS